MDSEEKKLRRFLDCVEIPSSKRVLVKKERSCSLWREQVDGTRDKPVLILDADEAKGDLPFIKNEPVDEKWQDIKLTKPEDVDMKPIKVKEEVFCLSEDSMLRRLQMAGCRPLKVLADREITKVGFQRLQLSKFLGGSTQQCFSQPPHGWERMHAIDVILYPSREWNPHTPIARGEPGLLFACFDEENSKNEAIPMFAKIQKRGGPKSEENLWYYFGHYLVRPTEDLTVEEYTALSLKASLLDFKARQTWSRGTIGKRWARAIRAGVQLAMEFERPATKEEITQRLRQHSAKDAFNVTPEQVDSHYLKGFARLAVSTMNCVRYDAAFQQHLVEKSEMSDVELTRWYWQMCNFKWKQSYAKKAAQGKPTSNEVKRESPSRGRKRKAEHVERERKNKRLRSLTSRESSPASEQLSDTDDEIVDEVQPWSYSAKGTKSRPMAVRRFQG